MTFNPNATIPGAVNSAGSDDALFLKIYGGEVLTAFAQSTQAMDKHKVRTITSGKSAQFPVMGRSSGAEYLTRGNAVTTSGIDHAESTISVDDKLVTSAFIYDYDEMKNHYDVRQEYSRQHGEELAVIFDKNVLRTGLLAARSASVVTGLPGGSQLVNAAAKTDASALVDSMFAARQTLSEKNVNEDANMFLLPAQYFMLINGEDRIINSDYAADGSFSDARVTKVAGLSIVMTNNLPSTAITGTFNAKYDVDATDTVALIMTNSAVGTVKLQEMRSEMEWKSEYQSHVLLTSMGIGHGVLRAEGAIEIVTA
jgi:hypothetical protein